MPQSRSLPTAGLWTHSRWPGESAALQASGAGPDVLDVARERLGGRLGIAEELPRHADEVRQAVRQDRLGHGGADDAAGGEHGRRVSTRRIAAAGCT